MMVTQLLERSVLPYIGHHYHRLIILDEEVDVATAAKLRHDNKAKTIIVVRNTCNKNFVGVVTDKDILEKVVIKGGHSGRYQLKNIMSSPLITISANANVRDALELMRLKAIKP
ncbi:MAG: CBS domain-containing protein [Candidatus Nitrosocosmicus sp.]|nr:CBS domain-containing protein [Candidatus Nitrosocosmicus sp.]MDN5866354.1 CBS domain-containing protein [Candidatus Nitrosocosmicus sp.]